MGAIWPFIKVSQVGTRTAYLDCTSRLLRRTLYPRRPMVMSEVYRLSRNTGRMPCLWSFLNMPLTHLLDLRPMSERRWSVQTNPTERLGSSSLCNLDTGNVGSQSHVHGAHHWSGSYPQAAMETGRSRINFWCSQLIRLHHRNVLSVRSNTERVFNATKDNALRRFTPHALEKRNCYYR